MKNRLLKYKDGKEEVHCPSPIQGDVSLCDHDLAGDDENGWGKATKTNRKIDCKDCLNIIDFCKSL